MKRPLKAIEAALILVLAQIGAAFGQGADLPLDVIPWEETGRRAAAIYDFASDSGAAEGWTPGPTVKLATGASGLVVTSTGSDPYIFSPALDSLGIRGDFLVKLTAKRTTTGFAQIFTAERDKPEYDETRAARFAMAEQGEFQEYTVPLKTEGILTQIRVDPGLDSGVVEIAKIELMQIELNPLKFGAFSISDGKLRFSIRNDGDADVKVRIAALGLDEIATVPARGSAERVCAFPHERPFETLDAFVYAADGKGGERPILTRRFYAYWDELSDRANAWPQIANGELLVRVSPDGAGALVFRAGDSARLAAIAPIVCAENLASGVLSPDFTREPSKNGADYSLFNPEFTGIEGDRANFVFETPAGRGQGTLRLSGDSLEFDFDSPVPVHAPVVRVLGEMNQAVLPGVEYLEAGERSSSSLDVNPDERARYAPENLWVTAPYATVVTDRCSATLLYENPLGVRVCFAVPNFLDGEETNARVNVCGTRLSGAVRFAPPEPIEASILWAVQKLGLPDPPKRPRTDAEEDAVHLAALERSGIKLPNGWASANGSGLAPDAVSYGSDFISTLWELKGELVPTPRVDPGGSNLHNYASLLLLCRGDLAKAWFNGSAKNLIKKQQDDGSFRYSGPYLRGSSVDYASGDCGRYVAILLEHWRLTGSEESLQAGLKGLAFINALKTPRGAQTWELSLHTPDIVAAARCSYANTLAYEATGERAYLDAARRWALSGLPFVYLWDARDGLDDGFVMRYATIPVYGTTNWIAPCWIGTPVQWCGLDYADALILLARYDDTLDWRRVAEGIVSSAERQEYPDGPFVGTLPDSYNIAAQQRNPLNINPCVVHMLRRKLEGKFTNVSAVEAAGKRAVVPFPARAVGNALHIDGVKGITYQILIDGTELRTVESQGLDVIEL